MIKTIKKCFIILLCCILVFSVALGCGEKQQILKPEHPNDIGVFEGVHLQHAVKTDKKIFKNAQTDYKIIVPQYAGQTLLTASAETRLFLNKASNGTINIVAENDFSGSKGIYLGKTEALAKAGIEYDDNKLGENGYRIVTKDDNIYIYGAAETGVLNGIYDFLNHVIGFNVYASDEVVYRVGDINFYDFDITETPDIQYRVADVTTRVDGDENYRTRLKLNSNDDIFMYAKGSLYHNDFVYLPPKVYGGDEYKDWFSENNGSTDYLQLCYSAHGKEAELNKMLEISADIIIQTAKESNASNITFMQQDVNSWCSCDTCLQSKQTYGTDSAVVIKFLNKLSALVKTKLKAEGINRVINICFFAYQRTEKAPVIEKGDGKYEPIDSSVVCADNVFVLYAPIYASYNKSFGNIANKSDAEALKGWNAISKKTYVWLYQTNFSHYLYPYNSLPTMQERYRFLATQGAQFIFDQNQWDQSTKTAFHRLKAWMEAKLGWNVNADYNTLLDEYFSGYFYDAAKPMRQLFDEITYHFENLSLHEGMEGGIYFPINQSKFFSKSMLDNWNKLIEEAYKSIEVYKQSDVELYERLESRICIESISIRYMTLDLYAGRYSPETLRDLRVKFMNDCNKYGVDKVAEIKDISTVFSSWGLI